jgi:hypothetical protein
MINVRNNIFETNSSSTHSVSLYLSDNDIFDTIIPNSDGQIVLTGGDFASVEFDVYNVEKRINLIAAYIVAFCHNDVLSLFEKVVKEHTGATHIIYDIHFVYINGKPANTFLSPEVNDNYDNNNIHIYNIVNNEQHLKSFIFGKGSYLNSSIERDG